MAGGALKQARSEPLLERLDGGGRDGARHAALGGRRTEAATVDDADKQVERGEAVHTNYSTAQNNVDGTFHLIAYRPTTTSAPPHQRSS